MSEEKQTILLVRGPANGRKMETSAEKVIVPVRSLNHFDKALYLKTRFMRKGRREYWFHSIIKNDG